ncbi:MAG: protein kinase [Planctomycetes bacterium]|nr:protein kinase [Planctomycetota bacterium]
MTKALELFFGKVAVELGYVSQQDVDDAIGHQDEGDLRSLGEILQETAGLSPEKENEVIRKQQENRASFTDAKKFVREDKLFGQILTDCGIVDQRGLNLALRRQAEHLEAGRKVRLGEILHEAGLLSSAALRKALELQDKFILKCPRCRAQYNIYGKAGKTSHCVRCKSELRVPEELRDVRVLDELRLAADEWDLPDDDEFPVEEFHDLADDGGEPDLEEEIPTDEIAHDGISHHSADTDVSGFEPVRDDDERLRKDLSRHSADTDVSGFEPVRDDDERLRKDLSHHSADTDVSGFEPVRDEVEIKDEIIENAEEHGFEIIEDQETSEEGFDSIDPHEETADLSDDAPEEDDHGSSDVVREQVEGETSEEEFSDDVNDDSALGADETSAPPDDEPGESDFDEVGTTLPGTDVSGESDLPDLEGGNEASSTEIPLEPSDTDIAEGHDPRISEEDQEILAEVDDEDDLFDEDEGSAIDTLKLSPGFEEEDDAGLSSPTRIMSVGGAIEKALANGESIVIRKYRLKERLGAGGMGIVYLAEDTSLGRLVAVKILPPSLQDDPDLVKRFEREAQAASRLDHPNIIKVYDFDEWNGLYFYAMQFIEGRDLGDIIGYERVKIEEAADWAYQLAQALNYAHTQGIVHRDIKPANIIIRDSDRAPMIADFGLASIEGVGTLTRTGDVIGTPAYMSPEQARGEFELLDARSDLYSLAATVYEIITGQSVVKAVDVRNAVLEVLTKNPTPPRKLNQAVPKDFETIILKSLEKEPQHRYLTAAEFARDVKRFLGGKTISARRPGTIEKIVKWTRRNKSAAAIIFLVSAILMGGIAFAGSYLMRRSEVASLKERAETHAQGQAFTLAVSSIEEALKLDPADEDLLGLAKEYRRLAEVRATEKQIDGIILEGEIRAREGMRYLKGDAENAPDSERERWIGSDIYCRQAIDTFLSALGLETKLGYEHEGLRMKLATCYLQRYRFAREIGLTDVAEDSIAKVEQFSKDENQLIEVRGVTQVTLATTPAGASVKVYSQEPGVIQYQKQQPIIEGATPLECPGLLPGSYVFEIELPGHLPTKYHAYLQRHEVRSANVQMVKIAPGTEELVYVPEGPAVFKRGGRVMVAGFLIQKTPVSNAQYSDYLATIENEFLRRILTPEGFAAALRANPQGPVEGAPWYGAQGYARWRGMTLPSSYQWLKATGGADGESSVYDLVFEYSSLGEWTRDASVTGAGFSIAGALEGGNPAYPGRLGYAREKARFRCVLPVVTSEVALDEATVQALCLQAVDLLENEKFSDAKRILDQLVLSKAEVPELWYNLGVAQTNLGERQKALDSFARAVALSPGNLYFRIIEALNLIVADREDDALMKLDEAEQMWKGHFLISLVRTYAHLKSGDIPLAAQRVSETVERTYESLELWKIAELLKPKETELPRFSTLYAGMADDIIGWLDKSFEPYRTNLMVRASKRTFGNLSAGLPAPKNIVPPDMMLRYAKEMQEFSILVSLLEGNDAAANNLSMVYASLYGTQASAQRYLARYALVAGRTDVLDSSVEKWKSMQPGSDDLFYYEMMNFISKANVASPSATSRTQLYRASTMMREWTRLRPENVRGHFIKALLMHIGGVIDENLSPGSGGEGTHTPFHDAIRLYETATESPGAIPHNRVAMFLAYQKLGMGQNALEQAESLVHVDPIAITLLRYLQPTLTLSFEGRPSVGANPALGFDRFTEVSYQGKIYLVPTIANVAEAERFVDWVIDRAVTENRFSRIEIEIVRKIAVGKFLDEDDSALVQQYLARAGAGTSLPAELRAQLAGIRRRIESPAQTGG